MARSLKCTVFCVNMGSKKNFIEKKICKVIELGKLYTSMIFFPKNLNSFIGEYAKNRAKSSLKILSFPAAPSLNIIYISTMIYRNTLGYLIPSGTLL